MIIIVLRDDWMGCQKLQFPNYFSRITDFVRLPF